MYGRAIVRPSLPSLPVAQDRSSIFSTTFEGLKNDDLQGIAADKAMAFADTSMNSVADPVGADGIKSVRGYFPGTQDQIPIAVRFAFVHLDCDLYKPFKAGLEFFYPRLVKGGFLVMHDYSSLWWDGVEKAIDEFFAEKPELVIPIPDKSGTAVIRSTARACDAARLLRQSAKSRRCCTNGSRKSTTRPSSHRYNCVDSDIPSPKD